MRVKLAHVALLIGLVWSGSALAQSAAQIGGPRELPPASFQGQQFVDSRGCVFLRAGFGGAINWVPRVDARRQVICGFPPTFGPQAPIDVAEDVPAAPPAAKVPGVTRLAVTAVVPPARTLPQPARRGTAPLPSPLPMPPKLVLAAEPAPYATAPPAPPVRAAAVVASGPGPGKIGCYTSAPVAEVVRLSNGGTAVVCTRGDGGLSGWRPPIYPAGRGVGAALSYPTRQASSPTEIGPGVTYAVADNAIPTPPKGYRLAWTDDRLNPLRGNGTAAGQAAQDRVWTREVPARLVVVAVAAPQPQVQTRVSTKTRPTEPLAETTQAATGPAYVQVGTFGVPANAEGAAARLKALGLPVAKGQMTSGGKALQVVYAGPFASASAAANALALARGAGFADAFIR